MRSFSAAWHALLGVSVLGLMASCATAPSPSESVQTTAIDSFGANPNPVPLNVASQFSWTVLGQGLVCQLDAEGDGTVDYTVQSCSSQSRVIHNYGAQGTYAARLTVSGADGKTVQQTTPVAVAAPNNAPNILSLIPSTPGDAEDPLEVQFSWMVTDPDADITHCRFDAESDGVWEYDGLCSGLPAASGVGKASSVGHRYTFRYPKKGNYEATLEAADAHVSTRTRARVRAPWNRAPVVDALKSSAGTNNSATIGFAVSDPDDDTLSCILTVQSIGTFHYSDCRKLSRTFTFPFPSSRRYGVTLEVTDPYQGKTVKQATVVLEPHPVQVVAGEHHSCALISNGDVYCWGRNLYGQLGNPTNADTSISNTTPLKVQGGYAFTTLATDEYHVCGLTAAGRAYCWGRNRQGELGNPTNFEEFFVGSTTPLPVVGGHTFIQLSGGRRTICGLTADGDAYCWGVNDRGQLGNSGNTDSYSYIPQLVEGGHTFTKISVGGSHVCGIAAGGTYCWGGNYSGQTGNSPNISTFDPNATPHLVAGTEDFVDVISGGYHTCGLTAAGKAYCWGTNYSGTLGNPANLGDGDTPNPTPLEVSGGKVFVYLDARNPQTCGITASGAAYCWGSNYYGQLGNPTNAGTFDPNPVPLPIDGGHAFLQIYPGNNHVCGLTRDYQAYCWGSNGVGQLASAVLPASPNPLPQLIPSPWLQ